MSHPLAYTRPPIMVQHPNGGFGVAIPTTNLGHTMSKMLHPSQRGRSTAMDHLTIHVRTPGTPLGVADIADGGVAVVIDGWYAHEDMAYEALDVWDADYWTARDDFDRERM